MRTLSRFFLLCFAVGLASPATAVQGDLDLGFEDAFVRPFYKTSSFGFVVTGTAVVAAGAFSYFTAGAGAPAAAAGVSGVASWVGGGGAGSYMAGLSTIGGLFGGNAMLGSAILNGISLGTVGAMGSWGQLTLGQKALALGASAATAMDGIAIIANPQTRQIEWRVVLPVPRDLAGDRPMRALVDDLEAASREVTKKGLQLEGARKKVAGASSDSGMAESAQVAEAKRALDEARGQHWKISERVKEAIDRAAMTPVSNRTLVLLAVLAQNEGRSEDFRKMLARISLGTLRRSSYVEYLRAIGELQQSRGRDGELLKDRLYEAEQLLRRSANRAPFAIEPPILLVGMIGSLDFLGRETSIDLIVDEADKKFSSNAYMSPASLVSLHYRVGTLALAANRCDRAFVAFKRAQSELSIIQKYWNGRDIWNLLEIGEANALHCQNKIVLAYEAFSRVWARTSDCDARKLLCEQYRGGCAN